MPETAIILQTSIWGIKGARRAQGRAEGRKGGQEGRQGGQEGHIALLFWPSWNTAVRKGGCSPKIAKMTLLVKFPYQGWVGVCNIPPKSVNDWWLQPHFV